MSGAPLQNSPQARPAAAPRSVVNGPEISHDEAVSLLALADAHRDKHTTQDYVEAARIYRQLGDSAFSCVRGRAFADLGLMLQAGRGVERDCAKGTSLFLRAAQLGNVQGMRLLAFAFFVGDGVPQSYVSAAHLYGQAANRGDEGARAQLGRMCMKGQGVLQSSELGISLLREAANSNCVMALVALADAFEVGTCVDIDMAESTRLREQAANLGDSVQQCIVGICYKRGEGVDQSFEQARRYFEMSAAQGNRVAINELAQLFQDGDGVQKDLATAKYYLKKASRPLTEKEQNVGVSISYSCGHAASNEATNNLQIARQTCSWCNARSENLRICSRCKGPRYCDADCQRSDWARHKKICKANTARANRIRSTKG
jgi:TPR repeat protein